MKSFIQKWLIDWLVVSSLKGLLTGNLNGNKLSLGLLNIIIGGFALAFPALPVIEFTKPITDALPVLPDAPISAQEVAIAIGSFMSIWGSIHKVIKWAKAKLSGQKA